MALAVTEEAKRQTIPAPLEKRRFWEAMALLVLACLEWKPRTVGPVSVGVRWDYIYIFIKFIYVC